MEIEMKDLLEGTENGLSTVPAESDLKQAIKLVIKKELKEETKSSFKNTCKVLNLILQNIVKNPEEEKFRTIKLSNPKFHQNVGKFNSAIVILELLGFETVHDTEPILIFHESDVSVLSEVAEIFEAISVKEEKPINRPVTATRPAGNRIEKSMQAGKEMEDQLKEYRNRQKYGVPRANPGQQNYPVQISPPNNNYYTPPGSTFYSQPSPFAQEAVDTRSLMVKVFELVNYFRVNQGNPALIWNEDLCLLCCEHSRNMAEGRTPVGHDGYKQRYKRFPFKKVKGGAENVAFNSGYYDPAKVCSDAWINSAPHRKNILGKFNYTAVGVFVNANRVFYFTQLYALVNI